jgi:hypothetical protein
MFASALSSSSQRSAVKEIFDAKEKSERLINKLNDPNISDEDKKKTLQDLVEIKEKLKKAIE